MITPKQKTTSLPSLIKELDMVFSQFIRYRDMDNGKVKCFICGTRVPFAEAQAMHYIDRDQMATRYDEINVNGGCESCNCYDPNHRNKYNLKMLDTFGLQALANLHARSHSLQKFMRHELEELIEHYKLKVSELKKKV